MIAADLTWQGFLPFLECRISVTGEDSYLSHPPAGFREEISVSADSL